MAIKILKHANKSNPIYFKHCPRCGCEFEFTKEDIINSFFDQREGYNVLYVRCPSCGDSTGIEDLPIRYE